MRNLNIFTSDNYFRVGIRKLFNARIKGNKEQRITIIDCRSGDSLVNITSNLQYLELVVYIKNNSGFECFVSCENFLIKKITSLQELCFFLQDFITRPVLVGNVFNLNGSCIENFAENYISFKQHQPQNYFTDRDMDVAILSLSGLTIQEVASKLELKSKTVYFFRNRCAKKLGFKNFHALYGYFIGVGQCKVNFSFYQFRCILKLSKSLRYSLS